MRLGQSLGPLSLLDPGSVGRAAIEVIASSTTIAIHSNKVRITGAVTIQTITPPDYFNGPLFIINTDTTPGTTGTSGNIALGSTIVSKKLLVMLYDPATSKWYPSY